MNREVVGLIRELRPDEGMGEEIGQLAALVHHVFLFWAAGASTLVPSVAGPPAVTNSPLHPSETQMLVWSYPHVFPRRHAAVPLDRLLLETDGPYLAPVPMRGKRNEPAFVRYTAARIAEVRGLDVQELINTTDQNAGRIFGPRLN